MPDAEKPDDETGAPHAVGRSDVPMDVFLAALAANEIDGFDVTPAEIGGAEAFRLRAIDPPADPDADDDPDDTPLADDAP